MPPFHMCAYVRACVRVCVRVHGGEGTTIMERLAMRGNRGLGSIANTTKRVLQKEVLNNPRRITSAFTEAAEQEQHYY